MAINVYKPKRFLPGTGTESLTDTACCTESSMTMENRAPKTVEKTFEKRGKIVANLGKMMKNMEKTWKILEK